MSTKKATASTAVAKRAPAQAPAIASSDDYEAHAGGGLENITARDLLIPRITILQDMSPQLKKTKSEFIAGSEVGDICDVGTGRLFKSGIIFLPVMFSKVWIEWAPRSTGKGLQAIRDTADILEHCSQNEKRQYVLPNGNLVNETAQFYGLNLSADCQRSFIPMTATQLKKARQWCTVASSEKMQRADGSSFTPPFWARVYKLTTADESNNDGDWKGWKIDPDLPSHEAAKKYAKRDWAELRAEIFSFIEGLKSGSVKGDVASMQSTSPDTDDDDGEDM